MFGGEPDISIYTACDGMSFMHFNHLCVPGKYITFSCIIKVTHNLISEKVIRFHEGKIQTDGKKPSESQARYNRIHVNKLEKEYHNNCDILFIPRLIIYPLFIA